MHPNKKGVKPFADCLFVNPGSTKTFSLNKHKHFTPEDVNLHTLVLREIVGRISDLREQEC